MINGKLCLAAGLALGLGACANSPNPRTEAGVAIGAGTGAVIGAAIGESGGAAVLGGIVGATAGGLIGNYMDRQQRDFERQLEEERRLYGLEIERLRNENLLLSIPNEVSFDFNSAELKPSFVGALDDVALVLQDYPESYVQVLGHTDSIGSETYNLGLSQQRADNVADYLVARGVDPGRMESRGLGETSPRASNDTPEGRALNRRVELVISPPEGQAISMARDDLY
ncbi:MAG: OmpA family protein [Candidatus Competibacterales bacterium]